MTTTRRALIGALAGGATLLTLPRPARARDRFPWPLGVQLWSVSAELEQNLSGTLTRLARLGFREVETAGLHGHTPAAFRRAVAAAGLSLVSVHLSMADLLADPSGSIGMTRDLGARWLICSSPRPDRPLASDTEWIPAMAGAMTSAAWKTNAAALNRLGSLAGAAGLGFGYHNHPFDFGHYDGRRAYDLLLQGTDPALVKLELDVAWAVAGGADPARLLSAHPDRFRLLHLKGLQPGPSLPAHPAGYVTADLARGNAIDWPAVLAAARRAGVRHAFVEQEPPYRRPVFQSLATAVDFLKVL